MENPPAQMTIGFGRSSLNLRMPRKDLRTWAYQKKWLKNSYTIKNPQWRRCSIWWSWIWGFKDADTGLLFTNSYNFLIREGLSCESVTLNTFLVETHIAAQWQACKRCSNSLFQLVYARVACVCIYTCVQVHTHMCAHDWCWCGMSPSIALHLIF